LGIASAFYMSDSLADQGDTELSELQYVPARREYCPRIPLFVISRSLRGKKMIDITLDRAVDKEGNFVAF
jgi:hypothetical protein